MNIKAYIDKNYKSNAEFARVMKTTRQHVAIWITLGYIVFNGRMWARRKKLPPVNDEGLSNNAAQLSEYIKTHYVSMANLGRLMNTTRQHVQRWDKRGDVVYKGWTYSRRQKLPDTESGGDTLQA